MYFFHYSFFLYSQTLSSSLVSKECSKQFIQFVRVAISTVCLEWLVYSLHILQKDRSTTSAQRKREKAKRGKKDTSTYARGCNYGSKSSYSCFSCVFAYKHTHKVTLSLQSTYTFQWVRKWGGERERESEEREEKKKKKQQSKGKRPAMWVSSFDWPYLHWKWI